jgi:hypothetical protein
VIEKFRRVPVPAYLFLAVSVVGAIVEVTYHFVPASTIPGLYQWINSLSPADKDFYTMLYELIAHIFIAVGLMGMVTVFVYQQIQDADMK